MTIHKPYSFIAVHCSPSFTTAHHLPLHITTTPSSLLSTTPLLHHHHHHHHYYCHPPPHYYCTLFLVNTILCALIGAYIPSYIWSCLHLIPVGVCTSNISSYSPSLSSLFDEMNSDFTGNMKFSASSPTCILWWVQCACQFVCMYVYLLSVDWLAHIVYFTVLTIKLLNIQQSQSVQNKLLKLYNNNQ